MQQMAPMLQSFLNCKKLPIGRAIVLLSRIELARKVCYWVKISVTR